MRPVTGTTVITSLRISRESLDEHAADAAAACCHNAGTTASIPWPRPESRPPPDGDLKRVGNSHRWTGKLDPVGMPDGGELFRIHRAGRQLGELLEEPLQPRWRGDHQQPP